MIIEKKKKSPQMYHTDAQESRKGPVIINTKTKTKTKTKTMKKILTRLR
jgi:hypothetical protein